MPIYRVERCPDPFPGDLLASEAMPGDELRPPGHWELVWEGPAHDLGVEQFIRTMDAVHTSGRGWVRMLGPDGRVMLLEGCDPEDQTMEGRG